MKNNKSNIVLLFSLSVLALLPLSCKKEKVETPKMHLNYFGLIPGRFVTYEVLEVFHDDDVLVAHDTLRYQLKTVIGNEFIDNNGRTAREFKRFKRNSSSAPWVVSDLWTAIIENYKAELVEENQRIIKLVFSPTEDKIWNPNTYNAMASSESNYENIHASVTLNNINFDSTLIVRQGYFKSLIDYQNASEIYATNIGLVSKSYKNLKIANFDTLNVKKGYEIHYKCLGYGFE